MSKYQEARLALEAKRCPDCHGLGERDDAEPGDTFFRKWVCPACRGSGLKESDDDSYATIETESKELGMSDMDTWCAWRLGLAVYMKMRNLGGKLPHDPIDYVEIRCCACGHLIEGNDDANVCIECDGRNRRLNAKA